MDRPDVYTRVRAFIDFVFVTTKLNYLADKQAFPPPKTTFDLGMRQPGHIECGGSFDIQSKSNIVGSPSWPGQYPTDLDCDYQFVAPRDHVVRIHFLYFQLLDDKTKTRLLIQESPMYGKPIKIGTFADTNIPKTVFSRKRTMSIKFRTQGAKVWKHTSGFLFEFQFVRVDKHTDMLGQIATDTCQFDYTERSGEIGFTMQPKYMLPCKFKIEPPINEFENVLVKIMHSELGWFAGCTQELAICPMES